MPDAPLARFWYRDRDTLASLVTEHGGATRISQATGTPKRTIEDWMVKHGLNGTGGQPTTRGPVTPIAVEEPVSREELLQAEVKELRSRLAKGRRNEVSNAALVATLEALVPTLEPIYAPELDFDFSKEGTPHKFMLDWSDLHAAEVVNGEQMNGINEYDWDIMLRRHDQMLKSIVSFKEKRPYPVDELIINGLGDMNSGSIHPELKETNDRPIMECALQLGLDMAPWIAALAQVFPTVRLSGVIGNHPRLTVKQSMKNRYDNFDWMTYHVIKLALKDVENVTVEVPKSAHHPIRVFNETHLLMHGDGIRSTMPGVPWGGVMRRVAELSNSYTRIGMPIDRFHVGHFHNPNIVEGGRIFMNGSVKGPDEYGLLSFGGGHDASQLLSVYHPRRGLTETCILDLSLVTK